VAASVSSSSVTVSVRRTGGGASAMSLHPSHLVLGSLETVERADMVYFDEPDQDRLALFTLVLMVMLGLLGAACLTRCVMWGLSVTTRVSEGCWQVSKSMRDAAGYVGFATAGLYVAVSMTFTVLLTRLNLGRVLWRYWLYWFRRNWSVQLWILGAGVCAILQDLMTVVQWGTLILFTPLFMSTVDVMAMLRGRPRLKWVVRFAFLSLFFELLFSFGAYTHIRNFVCRDSMAPPDPKPTVTGIPFFLARHLASLTAAGALVTYGHLLLKKFYHPAHPALNYSVRFRFANTLSDSDGKLD
jgi:hypothetical protein